MSDNRSDPLLLGQRVVAILETGLRTATYKLATLMALVDYATEHIPETTDAPLDVPIPDLAAKVLELYWRQVRPFGGKELHQSTQARARIPQAALDLRAAAGVGATGTSLAVAATRVPTSYQAAIDEIALCLARQPLYRLQRLPGARASDCFLYDDTFLHDDVSRRSLRERGDAITLKPGVATGLARLAGLLKPALEIMWVEDIRRMNPFLDEDVPDVAGHLFGRERVALAAVRQPLKDAFGARCFYCSAPLERDNPIDHVLPCRCSGSTASPISCRPALAATPTSATHCPHHRSSTGSSAETGVCWKASPRPSSGPPSTTVRSQPPEASIEASPREVQPGLACGRDLDLTWLSRTGG